MTNTTVLVEAGANVINIHPTPKSNSYHAGKMIHYDNTDGNHNVLAQSVNQKLLD